MEVLRLREEAEGVLGLRELEAQRHVTVGDVEKAEEALRDVARFWEKIVEEAPDGTARSRHLGYAYSNLGQILKATGRLDDAEEVYRKALSFRPEDPNALMLLAWLLAARPGRAPDKVAEGVRLAIQAAKASPEDARPWTALGMARYRAGQWSQTVASLERSMKLGAGGGPREWLFLAMARWKLGEKEEARTWYDKATARLEEDEKADGISSEMQGFREEADALLGAEGRIR
jgi:tetratricopeptide (TPR) repeat protein